MYRIDKKNISCPNCNQLTSMDRRHCPHCHADLAIAALIAEREMVTSPLSPGQKHAAPEMLVPRLGEILIEQGFITQEKLEHALKIQKEMALTGKNILTGELLVELGYISRECLDQTVTIHVLQLQAALANSNQQLEDQVQRRTSQLQDALTKLTELNRLKRNFISNVSHELRMPMQFLIGYLDLMSNGTLGALSNEQNKALNSIQGASYKLKHLIEDLLLYTSAANGEIPLDLAPVPLGSSVKTAVYESRPKADARSIFLDHQLSPAMTEVIADNQKITWVVEQFLDNAIKYTPQGGQVWVETTPLRGDVLVKVTDSGIGIPPERVDEIFEPFHQLDGSSTRNQGGTGLGLALARRIVEAHGSTIDVDTRIGQGSCFSFALPALDEYSVQ